MEGDKAVVEITIKVTKDGQYGHFLVIDEEEAEAWHMALAVIELEWIKRKLVDLVEEGGR